MATLGSIPACAGEPERKVVRERMEEVYPRVCGGTLTETDSSAPRRGLSPRVRGNRFCSRDSTKLAGSIPACAGEP